MFPSHDPVGQKLGSALNGATSGFAATQGAMALFGSENEALEESLLKVQSAMAISQGLQGIKESIASFRALGAVIAKTAIGQKALNIAQAAGAVGMRILNAVMNANPVFLIITGIAALTAAIVLFTKETESAQAAQDKLNSELDAYNNLLEKVKATADKVHDNRMRQLQLEGASETELHEERVRNIKTQEKLRVAELKSIKDINNQRRANLNKALKEGNKDLADSIKTEIQDSKKRYEELARQNKDYHLNLAEENKQFEEQEAQRRKEAWEKYKAAMDRDWETLHNVSYCLVFLSL